MLREFFDVLYRAYGPQHWWPAKGTTEIAIGAILTQNTSWTNVERAIRSLRRAQCLSWRKLRDVSENRLVELIRASGTYRVKAARLRALCETLWTHHGGSLNSLLTGPLDAARKRLLAVHGIGPETADAILLYAGGHLTFVVDAYTRRILRRHRLIDSLADYESVRQLFQASLKPSAPTYNEYHALLVAVGKNHCRSRANCNGCPLAYHPHDERL